MLVATLLDQSATATGFMAAAIAVGGFLAQAVPTLAGRDGRRLRQLTVAGGLWGIVGAVSVIVLSAIID
jgi:uncharacterized protein involved in response to NO